MGQKRNFWAPPFSLVDGVSHGTFATVLNGWKTGEGINVIKTPLEYKTVTVDKLLTPGVGSISEINGGNGLAAFPCEIFSDAFIARTSYVNTVLNSKRQESKPVSFEYGQYFGTTSLVLAYILVGFLNIGPFLIKIPGIHHLLSKLMGSGDGPSEASRKNLKTNVHSLLKVYENHSCSTDDPASKLVTEMELLCDNYTFTAVAVYECAKLMVNLRKKNQLPMEGGILSPISGLGGENLLPRLKGVLTLSKL
uniref:Uncharacterized protein n=1 Tax=Aplanochytrium stocchinoi TaxID=215587 RepID=A0A7S3LKC6_9STRA